MEGLGVPSELRFQVFIVLRHLGGPEALHLLRAELRILNLIEASFSNEGSF
jgi:hypothetical protein